jgi:hypothetical protein
LVKKLRIFIRNKLILKLGAVDFDIKETRMSGVFIQEDLEMRYTRQDTSHEDESKFEARLEAIK